MRRLQTCCSERPIVSPSVGSHSPVRPASARRNLFRTASLRRSGQAVSSEARQAVRPITRHAGQKKTRIETLRRQAIEGTASTPRGLPSLERLRPLERSAPRALQSLADLPGPGGSSRKRDSVQADPALEVFGHPVGSPSRRASRGWLPNQLQGNGTCACHERLGQCSLRAVTAEFIPPNLWHLR